VVGPTLHSFCCVPYAKIWDYRPTSHTSHSFEACHVQKWAKCISVYPVPFWVSELLSPIQDCEYYVRLRICRVVCLGETTRYCTLYQVLYDSAQLILRINLVIARIRQEREPAVLTFPKRRHLTHQNDMLCTVARNWALFLGVSLDISVSNVSGCLLCGVWFLGGKFKLNLGPIHFLFNQSRSRVKERRAWSWPLTSP